MLISLKNLFSVYFEMLLKMSGYSCYKLSSNLLTKWVPYTVLSNPKMTFCSSNIHPDLLPKTFYSSITSRHVCLCHIERIVIICTLPTNHLSEKHKHRLKHLNKMSCYIKGVKERKNAASDDKKNCKACHYMQSQKSVTLG